MGRRRHNQPNTKVRYTTIGGIILFQLFNLGAITFWFRELIIKGWDVAFLIPIVSTGIIQFLIIVMWKERKEALKKVAEWKAAGLEVRRWDPARRHYYKETR